MTSSTCIPPFLLLWAEELQKFYEGAHTCLLQYYPKQNKQKVSQAAHNMPAWNLCLLYLV